MRCKRCGSKLNYDDAICKGCGKSLVDLKASDEIEFDDKAVINIEPIKHVEVPKHDVEKPKVDDIFGDAMYNHDKVENETLSTENVDNVEKTELIRPDISNIASETNQESTTFIPKEEEKINFEPIPNLEIKESSQNYTNNEKVENNITSDDKMKSVTTNEMSDEFTTSKKSKKGMIFGIITMIVLILTAIVAFIFIKTDPKSIFESGIAKLFSYINLDSISNSNSKSEIYLKLSIDDVEKNPIYEVLNNLDVKVKTQIDKKNKNLVISLDSKYGDSDLFNASIYGSNSKFYALLQNVYEKYIEISVLQDTYDKIFEESDYSTEVKNILEELKKEMNSLLDKKYFSRTIKGTNTISTFSLDKKESADFIKNFLNKIKNNEKIIGSISTLNNSQNDDLKQSIDSILSEIEEGPEIKIEINSSVLEGTVNSVVIDLKDAYEKISMTIETISESAYSFVLKTVDSTIDGTVDITSKNGFKEYTFTINDEEIGKVTYIIGYKINYDEIINLPDLSNSINYDEITSEEFEEILSNLFQNEGIMKLYEIFDSTIATEEDTTDVYNELDVEDNNIEYDENYETTY